MIQFLGNFLYFNILVLILKRYMLLRSQGGDFFVFFDGFLIEPGNQPGPF